MNNIEVTLEETFSLPNKIKILHREFDLRERTYKEGFGSSPRLAEINFLENEINYLPLQNSETVDSIIHEVLHGIFRMFALNLDMSDGQEELIVSALATGLTTVMKDNPDLFYSLQDMLEDE